jgi:putative metalloprotease
MFGPSEVLFLILLIVVVLVVVPRLQRQLERRVDEGAEGRKALSELARRTPVVRLTDGLAVRLLTALRRVGGFRVAEYRLHRSEEPGVNAIALPSGDIVVTAGLLELVERGLVEQDELAAVLAHELAHVELGHSRQAQVRETMARWATMALPPGIAGAARVATGFGVKALSRRASREAECAADAWAIELLERAGFERDALASFLGKTAAWSGGGGLWSTHPAPKVRIAALEASKG